MRAHRRYDLPQEGHLHWHGAHFIVMPDDGSHGNAGNIGQPTHSELVSGCGPHPYEFQRMLFRIDNLRLCC